MPDTPAEDDAEDAALLLALLLALPLMPAVVLAVAVAGERRVRCSSWASVGRAARCQGYNDPEDAADTVCSDDAMSVRAAC